MNKKQIQGYIMAGVGFVMILINALSYIFNLGMKSSPLLIMSLVFVAIGAKTIRANKK